MQLVVWGLISVMSLPISTTLLLPSVIIIALTLIAGLSWVVARTIKYAKLTLPVAVFLIVIGYAVAILVSVIIQIMAGSGY